jgi:hypothetical protein
VAQFLRHLVILVINVLAWKGWYVSTMLTMLFVYHDPEDCPRSLISAPRASDRLLVERCSEVAEQVLHREVVDAVVLHQDHLQHGCNVVAEVKRVAPRMPLMLLRDQTQQNEPKPPGIAAVCRVDLGDEELVKSLWGFLRLILGKQVLRVDISTELDALSRESSVMTRGSSPRKHLNAGLPIF